MAQIVLVGLVALRVRRLPGLVLLLAQPPMGPGRQWPAELVVAVAVEPWPALGRLQLVELVVAVGPWPALGRLQLVVAVGPWPALGRLVELVVWVGGNGAVDSGLVVEQRVRVV